VSHFQFVVPPMTGHINPTVAVAQALTERGHRVSWIGHGVVLDALLPQGAEIHRLDDEMPVDDLLLLLEKAGTVRGLAGLKFLWEEVLIPLARAMHAGVERVVLAGRPDVLVVDQQALAGALVARAQDLPWVTFATTSADRRESLGDLPRVFEWTEDCLTELQRDLGVEPVREPENSPHLVIVFSTAAMVGDTGRFSSAHRFVGPAFGGRGQGTEEPEFPWEDLAESPRVLVSLGTLNAERGGRFFEAVKQALGGENLQVILVAPDEFGPFPGNFIVRARVPQVALLPKMDAVVCHGGHNTVTEALSNGLPLVVCPIKDDQPVIAKQVVKSGAGLRLSFTRPRPAQLRDAVHQILGEGAFRESAVRVRDSFVAAGGAAKAAELMEKLG